MNEEIVEPRFAIVERQEEQEEKGDRMSDLFEVPQPEDNDMEVEDLLESPEETDYDVRTDDLTEIDLERDVMGGDISDLVELPKENGATRKPSKPKPVKRRYIPIVYPPQAGGMSA